MDKLIISALIGVAVACGIQLLMPFVLPYIAYNFSYNDAPGDQHGDEPLAEVVDDSDFEDEDVVGLYNAGDGTIPREEMLLLLHGISSNVLRRRKKKKTRTKKRTASNKWKEQRSWFRNRSEPTHGTRSSTPIRKRLTGSL